MLVGPLWRLFWRAFAAGVVTAYLLCGRSPAKEPTDASVPALRWLLRPTQTAACRTPPVVTALAIDSSGEWLAAGGDDQLVHLWQLTTGRYVRSLRGHEDWIHSLLFGPQAQVLLSAGADGRVLRWDCKRGQLQSELTRCDVPVVSMAVNVNQKQLLLTGYEQHLTCIDVASGRHLFRCDCPSADMRCVKVSSDQRLAAAGGRNGCIRVWALPHGGQLADLAAPRARIRALAFARDGRLLISAAEDRQIRIWDVAERRQVAQLDSGPAKVLSLVTCGDGRFVTAGSDNRVRVWDLPTEAQIRQLAGHTGTIAALAAHEDLVVSGGYDATIRVWSLSSDTQDRAATCPADRMPR